MAGLLGDEYMPSPVSQGLLQFGAALMTPRELGGGIGPGLLAFNQGAMQAQQMRRQMEQDAMARKLYELKLFEAQDTAEERKRQRAQQEALQRAAQAAYTPASPGSLGGGVTPGSQQGQMLLGQMSGDQEFDRAMLAGTNSALNSVGPQQSVSAPTEGGFDMNKFFGNVAQVAPLEAMRLRKEMLGDQSPKVVGDALVTHDGRVIYEGGKPQAVAPGGALVSRDGRVVFQAAERPPAPSDISRLISEMEALPPNDPRRAFYAAAINKAISHPPGANQNVFTGSMVAVEGPDGKPAYAMPAKDGSYRIVLGVAPPGTAKDTNAATNQRRSTIDMATRMVADVESALSKLTSLSAGAPGKMLSAVPGTDAADLRATIVTLKANLGFNELQQIRAASPTGGALGATSENELLALQSTIANLDPNQSPAQLRQNLEKVRRHMQNIRSLIEQQNGAAGASSAFPMLPNANEFDGKTVRDTVTGKRYRSEGGRWVEVQ